MNPLVVFTMFTFATMIRAYLYPPTPEATSRSDQNYDQLSTSYGFEKLPSSAERDASILSFSRNIKSNIADATSFSTSNGISSSHNVYVIPGQVRYQGEHGKMIETDASVAMNGHSYHKSPEGMHVSLTWSADQSGSADNLPKTKELSADYAEAHRQAQLASSSLYGGSGKSFNRNEFDRRSGNNGFHYQQQNNARSNSEDYYVSSGSETKDSYIQMVPVHHHPAHEPITVMYEATDSQSPSSWRQGYF